MILCPLSCTAGHTTITSQWLTGTAHNNCYLLTHHGKVCAQSTDYGALTCRRLTFCLDTDKNAVHALLHRPHLCIINQCAF